MLPEPPNSQPDPLDPLLERWNAVPAAPPVDELHREVWRRIADAETLVEISFWSRTEKAFRTPSFACAFVAACTLLGLFLAEVRVSHEQSHRNHQLAQAYVHLIDPLLEPSGKGHLFADSSPSP